MNKSLQMRDYAPPLNRPRKQFDIHDLPFWGTQIDWRTVGEIAVIVLALTVPDYVERLEFPVTVHLKDRVSNSVDVGAVVKLRDLGMPIDPKDLKREK